MQEQAASLVSAVSVFKLDQPQQAAPAFRPTNSSQTSAPRTSSGAHNGMRLIEA